VVMDSFAWIEYFSGSSSGESVKTFLERRICLTPTIVVAELSEKYKRAGESRGHRFDFIRGRSRVVLLDDQLDQTAGEISLERRKKVGGWGMADSIVLATGRRSKARVVAEDPHFRDLTNETITI